MVKKLEISERECYAVGRRLIISLFCAAELAVGHTVVRTVLFPLNCATAFDFS